MADKYNGIINVYKEPGFTSHDVVAKLRGITHQRKIGHTGTLDPAAVGVLCVCFGAATRICDMIMDQTKEYEAVLLLGKRTDTQDTTGRVLEEKPVNVSAEEVFAAISSFVGEIEQIPPMYSARKVDGKKLYDLARAGIEVEREARKITVYEIEILDMNLPRVTMRVTCSKGTYIRTLCNDIGEKLGCGGTMEKLTRTRVGDFSINESFSLDQISEYEKKDCLNDILTSPSKMFEKYPAVRPNERGEKLAMNGNVISISDLSSPAAVFQNLDKIRLISEDGFFFGVYRYEEEDRIFKPVKMFLC